MAKKAKKYLDKYTAKEATKRLFIAVDLPDSAKNYLYKITSNLNKKDRDIRAITEGNIHLTLKFLGETQISKIEKIAEAVKMTAASFDKFNYAISSSFGVFPRVDSARILFVPVLDGEDKIKKVFLKLENNLNRINIKREDREFICHITVARIRNKKNIADAIGNIKIDYGKKLDCSKLTMFESILNPSGAEYIILDEFELK